MSTARRYFDEHPDHPCHWSPSTSVTPHTSIVQGYHGLLPACKFRFFAGSAARYDLVACGNYKSRTALTLQQMLPIVPFSPYHIHFSTSEEAIVLFFLTLALMQPYIPHIRGHAPTILPILLSGVQRAIRAQMASVGSCELISLL
jgi:hypothetical protein